MINLDGADTAFASWSGPTPYVCSWEKQTNLHASPAVSDAGDGSHPHDRADLRLLQLAYAGE